MEDNPIKKVSVPSKKATKILKRAEADTLMNESIKNGAQTPPLQTIRDLEESKKYSYPASQTVKFGTLSKFAFSSGNSINAIFSSPQFFSPLHTNFNWQIANKRREVAMWTFHPNTEVLVEDFTYKGPKEIVKNYSDAIYDTLTGGIIYENIDASKILDSNGNFNSPIRYSERECENKRFFSVYSYGNWRNLNISEEHMVLVIDGNNLQKSRKIESGEKYRSKVKNGTGSAVLKSSVSSKMSIVRKEAKDLKDNDLVLFPAPNCGEINLDKIDSWLIGACIADGCISENHNNVKFTINKNEKIREVLFNYLSSRDYSKTVSSKKHGDGLGWRITVSTKESMEFFKKYITGKRENKKFTKEIFELDMESRLALLGGYFDGDGSFSSKTGKLVAANCSKDMADQIFSILLSCGIPASLNKKKSKIDKNKSFSTREIYYSISVPSSHVGKIAKYMVNNKINFVNIKKKRDFRFMWKDSESGTSYLCSKIRKIESFIYNGSGYDLEINPTHALVSNGFVASNCRHYYLNEPRISAAVNIYSQFTMNGFKIVHKSKKVTAFFEKFCKNIGLPRILRMISQEYHLLGDVFPFKEIECGHCGGSGFKKDGKPCFHEGGKIRRIVLLNPDWIEVEKNPFSSDVEYTLTPDEEIMYLVSQKNPSQLYKKLRPELVNIIASGQPIRLSSRCISHIKYGEIDYGTYGTPMMRCLFPYLAYKTKLMTVNTVIAERLILPIRIIKVGDKDRPADDDTLAEITGQISAIEGNPALTLVTHHAFELTWEGASGKIQNINAEMEYVDKMILDGMMMNQALLNSEGPSYSGVQVGIEVMIKRMDSWRSQLAEWVEKELFLPMAMMNGFVDKEKSKDTGEEEFEYPKLVFDSLGIRDDSNEKNMKMQLFQQKLISARALLEVFNIDYDQMVEERREEDMVAGPAMQAGGPGGGGPMDLGMPGGGGGGGMPPMPSGPDMGGAPGGAPGGDIGGGMPAPGGDMGSGAGGVPTSASAGGDTFISKKGKGKKKEEVKVIPPKIIKLTKLEQKLYKYIRDVKLPYHLYGQYQVHSQGNYQPYLIDFAFPNFKIGFEADGEMWHSSPEQKQKNANRDQNLAKMGWTIVRFTETAIEEQPEEIKKTIYHSVLNLAKNNKKSSIDEEFVKTASSIDSYAESTMEDLASSLIKFSCITVNGDVLEDDAELWTFNESDYKTAVSLDGSLIFYKE